MKGPPTVMEIVAGLFTAASIGVYFGMAIAASTEPKEVYIQVPPEFCQGVIEDMSTGEKWTFCKMHPSWVTEPKPRRQYKDVDQPQEGGGG